MVYRSIQKPKSQRNAILEHYYGLKEFLIVAEQQWLCQFDYGTNIIVSHNKPVEMNIVQSFVICFDNYH